MSPALARSTRLQRRASIRISTAGTIAIVSLVSLAVIGIFCTAVFFLVCKKQRAREKQQRRMQEERRPFVPPLAQQYQAQQHPTQPYPAQQSFQNSQPYLYDGPIELQADVNTGQSQNKQAQQLDGFEVPLNHNNRPAELPSYGVRKA